VRCGACHHLDSTRLDPFHPVASVSTGIPPSLSDLPCRSHRRRLSTTNPCSLPSDVVSASDLSLFRSVIRTGSSFLCCRAKGALVSTPPPPTIIAAAADLNCPIAQLPDNHDLRHCLAKVFAALIGLDAPLSLLNDYVWPIIRAALTPGGIASFATPPNITSLHILPLLLRPT
jgi:hypothetical protein